MCPELAGGFFTTEPPRKPHHPVLAMPEMFHNKVPPQKKRKKSKIKVDLESLLDFKEIQAIYRKGDQSWVFIGRTDVEPETPILWPPDAKN